MHIKINRLLSIFLVLAFNATAVSADRVSAGDSHSIAVTGNGFVFSWGANADRQLGDGTTLDALNPLNVVDSRYRPLTGAISVDSFGTNNIVLLDDHTMLGWGSNENYQLGSGVLYSGRYRGVTEDTQPADPGAPVTGGTDTGVALELPAVIVDPEGRPIANVTRVVTGPAFSAALKQDGTVVVWGRLDAFKDREQDRKPVNRLRYKYYDPAAEFVSGRYLNGDPANSYDMLVMTDAHGQPVNDIIDIAAGDRHLLALTGDGTVLAWGENDVGQLADGSLRQRHHPVRVLDDRKQVLRGITRIRARGAGSYAIRADGRVFGWGETGVLQPEAPAEDPGGRLRRPEESHARLLIDPFGQRLDRILDIAAGNSHILAITFDHTVIGWGDNSYGQLGNGTNSPPGGVSTVIDARGVAIRDIVEVAVGDNHSLAVRRDGKVYAWGSAENGRLGDGTNVDSYFAIEVRDSRNRPFSLY